MHFKQIPLSLTVDDGEPIFIEVPYTLGEWSKTVGVSLELYGGETIRISREKVQFGIGNTKVNAKEVMIPFGLPVQYIQYHHCSWMNC